MGRPVIASEVGGLAFLIQDGVTGYHIPSRDPEALASRLYTLLADEGCRESMGRAARRYAEGFDWAIIAGRIVAVYADLLGRSALDASAFASLPLVDTTF